MTYKLTKQAEGREPLEGGPAWGDLTDEEFAAAEKAYAAAGYPLHALRNSGYWEHVEDKASSKKED